jgi:hypothetical protein
MDNRKRIMGLVLLGFIALGTLRLGADTTVVPLTSAQVGQDPYKFNGLIMAEDYLKGSGAVVRHTNIVMSAAHVVYDGENLIDPWIGAVRWF